jgi:hypothetical protein
MAAGVRAFVLTKGDLQGPEMARLLVRALPAIAGSSAQYRAPFIARISASGKVVLLQQLTVPIGLGASTL